MSLYKRFTAPANAVLIAGLLIGTSVLSPVSPKVAASSKPNIILIMLDDVGQTPFDALVDSGLAPNMAALKARGLTFRNSFVSNARGCPDRITMLTGQYYHNSEMPDGKCGVSLFDDSSTLPVWLKAGGYTTALIGRYTDGLGYTDINRDQVLDIPDIRYVPPGWDWWQPILFPYTANYVAQNGIANWFENANACGYYLMTQASVRTYDCSTPANYQSDVLGGEATKYIQARAGKQAPFFLAVTPTVSHVEVWPDSTTRDEYTDGWKWLARPPDRYQGTTGDFPLPPSTAFNEAGWTLGNKPPWVQGKEALTVADTVDVTRQYRSVLGGLRAIDDMVGMVTTALASSGQLENTVIILTSDNGWLYGEHRLVGKLAAYEESIRVPLVIAGPGVEADSSDALVLNNDLAPTIAELASTSTNGKEDGVSLVPLFSNPGLSWRQKVLLESWQAAGNTDNAGPFAVPTLNAIRTHDKKLVQYGSGQGFAQELYLLQSDPYELFNEASNAGLGNVKTRLHRDLMTLRGCGRKPIQTACQQVEFSAQLVRAGGSPNEQALRSQHAPGNVGRRLRGRPPA